MKKILVRGPALTRSGYGEHTRFILRALRQYEDHYDVYLIPVDWGKTGWIYEASEEREWIDSLITKTAHYTHQNDNPKFDVSLQVTIPNEWQNMAKINIGVTAGIEATKVAPVWIEKGNEVDRIITISEFSKYVYQNTYYDLKNGETGQVIKEGFGCNTPIDVIHYPVRNYEPKEVNLKLDTDFNFLVVAQWSPRKNLENTISWFVEEFVDQEVGLIIKGNVVNNSLIDRKEMIKRVKLLLDRYPQRKCKVYVLHGEFSDEEMTFLYNKKEVKALISIAHGEGFGLPIFEAAYSAMPVVATNWSGHLDFLCFPVKDKKNKVKNKSHFAKVDFNIGPINKEAVWDNVLIKESMWAHPEQGSYKMRLREVYKDYGRFESQAKKLQKWISENFVAEEQYKKVFDSIESTNSDSEQEVNEIYEKLFAEGG